MSDNEIGVEEVQAELEQLKQSATRKKGRGFADQGDKGDARGSYDTLRGEGPGPQRSIDGWTIFVTGINEEVVEEDMMDQLGEYGKVLNMHLNLDRRTGYLKGYCVAQYETKEEAEAAIKGLNGAEFADKLLQADWAFVSHKRR
ncbi:RNA-binding protein 8A [Aphelenchoides besseyi]|nr:RNA-binding protein 8A [Aphelenchoides besseyi]KAI6232019.1 RNA-binding protein 8A [Aphelenchoides besseyi]